MQKIIKIIFLMLVTSALSTTALSTKLTNPEKPEIPTINGQTEAEFFTPYNYTITSTDPQKDKIYYKIRCSDCPSILITDYIESGEIIPFQHCWCDFYQKCGPFFIKAKAIDEFGHESEWGTFEIQCNQVNEALSYSNLLTILIERFPILQFLLGKIK
jgi:hypothetical protein